jgi:hypothetical protein
MVSSLAIRFRSFADSDLVYSFRRSKVTVVATIVLGLMVLGALLAPLIAADSSSSLWICRNEVDIALIVSGMKRATNASARIQIVP